MISNIDYFSLAKNHGTPLYVYDLDALRLRAQFFKKNMPIEGSAFFAMKANNNSQVLKVLQDEGFGIDAVSMGEMQLAINCGFKGEQIVFSGVAKTEKEILFAIANKIRQINIESIPELERIILCSKKIQKNSEHFSKVPVALRMNPDIGVNTHPYIQTGFRENKFGLDFSEIQTLVALLNKNTDVVELKGLTLHIGSQIREVESFAAAIKKTLSLYISLREQGFALGVFDIGGGLGIDYNSTDLSADENLLIKYMQTVNELLAGKVKNIFFEPGRMLVARFGVLLSEIQYVKRTAHKNFVIVDAGMNELIRPALYQAFHRIEVLTGTPKNNAEAIYDIVGPICESADTLGRDRYLPFNLQPGEIIAIYDVGAYGAVMSSRYNLREPAKQIVVSNGRVL